MNYQAALFDFDGTVTVKGKYAPSEEMAEALVDLARKVPMGFCTGREKPSFLEHGLSTMLEKIPAGERDQVLSNVFLLAENGAIGYYYEPTTTDFEEFYRVPWPEAALSKEKVESELNEVLDGVGEVLKAAHQVVVVARTKFSVIDGDPIDSIYEYSEKVYERIVDYLGKKMPEYENILHVGNSGIGVVIGPADGDKDTGIRNFGKFLEEKRGMKFSEHYREIMAIGDRPHTGGNDHYFLSGLYGSPFTVGSYNVGWTFPKPVLSENGERLLHAEGTLYLLAKHF